MTTDNDRSNLMRCLLKGGLYKANIFCWPILSIKKYFPWSQMER